ncbi:hypothetical protein OLMES_1525 [Oleiphilus messinensis]|uniref:LysM domain-containing protein n=2 Tax=Oleiphilus messinensis TaxID=141451 RepID=A0A1Y0I5T0_9GAMM|nr:hypothetical protein OLMES_1525 [Oleiphilus messinensis]
MTDVYLCRNGDSLEAICADLATTNTNQQNTGNPAEYHKLITAANPHLTHSSHHSLKDGDLIILPNQHQKSSSIATHTPSLTPEARRNLSIIANQIGGDATVALAYVIEQVNAHLSDMNTFGGAGMGAAATKASDFMQALNRYDRAVHQFENLRNHRAAPSTMQRAQTAINEAYIALQTKFNGELNKVLENYVSKTKTVPLSAGVPKSRTAFRSMPLKSAPIVKSLATFGRYAKILGPAAIAADGYFRYDTVMDVYNSGGNWHRELYAQSAGFTTGIGLGVLGLTFLLGPFGWILGILLAGTLAVVVDRSVVWGTKQVYDLTQRW